MKPITMRKSQDVPSEISPEALTNLLKATFRSQGGNWRLVNIVRNHNNSLTINYSKQVNLLGV